MKYILFAGCLMFATHSACCGDQSSPSADQAAINAALQSSRFSGKVIETMNAGGYTYIRLDTGTKKIWAAAPQLEVKVGDSVVIADGMAMPNHHSKVLNRDFDLVYFTGDLTVNGSRPGAAKATELPKNHPPISGSPAPDKMDFSQVKKAKGGKTIEEIFAGKAKLSGQQVIVRGKVVKYNAMILGKNWVHLRDGSGAEGSNDLLVTTASAVKLGDTVVATGAVSLKKDFGSGYKYDVMIEDAKLVVE